MSVSRSELTRLLDGFRWRPTDKRGTQTYSSAAVWRFPGSGRAAAFPINKPGEESSMNATKIAGMVLIVLGLAGFFTGGFSFTKDSTAAKIGPIELTVREKQSVNIPQWLSLGAVALGAVLLVAGFKKS
jgi:hypothetical protein